ncbi:MAG: DUF4825 domain-containing protein [Firmicutes bacterium]|nr:DUF4825 domain-containing protein [Bacillota bacterium]MBR6969839.1 DUF4825 domain-containing protein [Bacillota bacterium]
MKNDLTCAVVRDLLPSYIEKLTSEETNEAVERHLEGCEECRKVLAVMQGEGGPAAEENKAEAKEIDYLKKVRTGTWKRVIAGILAAAFVFGAGAWIKVHRIGSYVDPSAVNITSVVVSGDTVAVAGNLKDKSLGVTHADMLRKEGGVMELAYRAAKKGGKDNEFSYAVSGGNGYADVQEIRMGDRIVAYQGVLIDEQVSAVYNARHPYVGDMSANGALAGALGIREAIGPYENELSTAAEPYGWTFYSMKDLSSRELATIRQELQRDAAVMLACVDNLGWVEFQFANGTSLKLTAEDASAMRNTDIKKEADNPIRLQLLMKEWPKPVYFSETTGN